MDLILASTSPYRRALLDRLGVSFRCESPTIDEEALESALGNLPPRSLAEALATAKALSLVRPGVTIVAGDQLVAFRDQVLGKPGTADRAIAQLAAMAGQAHELITALTVWHEGRVRLHTDITRLTMRPLARREIERYVAADKPWDCAGAYKLEQRGITLFERIDGMDHSAITGLPLIALTTFLRDAGFAIP